MSRSLVGRISALMVAAFVLLAGALSALSLQMPELQRMLELAAELVLAAMAFALLAALAVFNLLTQRLQRLAAELEAFRASGYRRAVALAWARRDGDEIDRVAQSCAEISDHVARQFAELAQHEQLRSQLLANVSHDLRTPLTLMQGYLETLLLRAGDADLAEQRRFLQVAARHAERMGRLVADLFELSRLDAARGERLSLEPFALTELAQDVAQKFALPAQEREVRLETRIDGATPPVLGDIGLVERALENLVENALRHTPRGGRVGIEVQHAGHQVAVSVHDTGCGIASEHLPHLFERYFQAPRIEPELAPGESHHAGLGLAITQRIVALHGGRIRVRSTPGQGTAFSFELPGATSPA